MQEGKNTDSRWLGGTDPLNPTGNRMEENKVKGLWMFLYDLHGGKGPQPWDESDGMGRMCGGGKGCMFILREKKLRSRWQGING